MATGNRFGGCGTWGDVVPSRPMVVDPHILWHLQPERLIEAYRSGLFPMVERGELYWFCPDPRGVMPLDERFHVSRSLRRTIRRGIYECTVNRAFDAVMTGCAMRDEGTWISLEMRMAYNELHARGLACSIEAWPAGQVGVGAPVGGVYGVAVGGVFCAESMFHTRTDAGKVALVELVERLRRGGFSLMDIQWTTPNLVRWGAFDMPRSEYLDRLAGALDRDASLA